MELGTIFTLFFVLFHFLLCLSAQQFNQSKLTCPSSFQCRHFDRVGFPFSNISQPDCGLSMVDCNSQPYPKIQLSQSSGQRFYGINMAEYNNNRIYVKDFILETLLSKQSCNTFLNYTDLPTTPSISFMILYPMTLLRCQKGGPQLKHKAMSYFNGTRSYKKCREFNVYYGIPNNQSSVPPTGCSLVKRPWKMSSPEDYKNHTNIDLFEMLTAGFVLEWRITDECYYDCHRKGGQCRADKMNKFLCATLTPVLHAGSNKRGLILGTAVAGSAFLFIVFLLGFLFWFHKRRAKNGSYVRSGSISNSTTIPNLEVGSVYFGVPNFSYSELEEATNNFDSSKELGDGGFGTVYYGKLRNGREVAVKRFYEHNFKRMEQFTNEIRILTRLKHPNLVTLYGCSSRHSRELLLVYQYIPNGTVADHLHGDRANHRLLKWPFRMKIAIETADALAYLHASDIIHRDVKTNNILLDHNFCVKVADFGLSRLFPDDVTHVSTAPQGTPGYIDPEYHQCYQLTDRSDVYSFGVVLIELISSMPAVDIRRDRHEINLANCAINKIQRCAFDELIDPSLGFESDPEVMRMTTSVAELAFRCLQNEKEMRPTMDEVLETLKQIQDYKENSGENIKETNENDDKVFKSKVVPPSPESQDVLLVGKYTNFPPSPISVTDTWVSSSSPYSTSR